MSDVVIRPIEQRDLPTLLDIYNHYVLTAPITFDVEPKTLEDRKNWFAKFSCEGRYRCLVAAHGNDAIGWASSLPLHDRAAYETSVLASVYLAPSETGKGVGRRLYESLFAAIADEDIHRIHAGITYPNPGSVALHVAMGFRLIGVQTEVGRKFGKFWDVGLYERALKVN
jgi:phosphinothricin acetyltransferase